MRKNILVLLALLVMSVSLNFHFTTSLAQTAEQPVQSAIEVEAKRIYSNLNVLSIRERKAFYQELTPELKSEVWRVQLRSFLSKHPDLTDKQRQSIESLIVFLTPQVYEIPQDSPGWEEKVNNPLQNITKRINEVFPREVVRELLTVLGGSESSVSLNVRRINFVPGLNDSGCANTIKETNTWLPKKKLQTQQPFMQTPVSFRKESCNCNNKKIPLSSAVDNCECSTRSGGDCFEGTICAALEGCNARQFCGTAYLYICNGLCYFSCSCE